MSPGPLLLARTDRIGDVVLSTAVLDPLREAFPDTPVHLAVGTALADLLSTDPVASPLAVDTAPQAHRRFRPRRFLRLRRQIRPLGCRTAVFLQPDLDLQAAAAAASIPRRIGYRGPRRGRFLTDRVPSRREVGTLHEARAAFDPLAPLGIQPPPSPQPRVHLPGGESHGPPALVSAAPFAILHATAHGDKPTWPAESFVELAAHLHAARGWRILLVGDRPHEALAGQLATYLPPAAWEDRGGRDALGATARLLAAATVVISRDSGPAHLAAALGTPLVCLMGQCDGVHSPVRWQPLGAHTRTLIADLPAQPGESRRQHWQRCFRSLSPQAAARAVDEVVLSA